MKRIVKRRIKNSIKSMIIISIIITMILNGYVFEKPLTFLGNTFGALSTMIFLPYGNYSSTSSSKSDKKTENKESSNEQTTEKQTTTSKETTSQTTTTKSDEVVAANASSAGRIVSQTITKEGATASYGDVYVKNKTGVNISIPYALKNVPELKIKLNSTDPQVLLVHTHATETFFPKLASTYASSWPERDDDTSKNMIAVGKVIKDSLNKAGINTVQSTVLHDQQDYNGSYDRSRETIKKYLEKYPSIKVVLDIHRDAINEDDGDRIRPIVNVNSKTAGQIMLICGCETGCITNYPNWRKNLRFGLRLQQQLEQTYPNFARPLFFAEKKYNQDLCPNSLLVEVGSQANVISEAKYSAKLFAQVLAKYLKNYS